MADLADGWLLTFECSFYRSIYKVLRFRLKSKDFVKKNVFQMPVVWPSGLACVGDSTLACNVTKSY